MMIELATTIPIPVMASPIVATILPTMLSLEANVSPSLAKKTVVAILQTKKQATMSLLPIVLAATL